MTAKHLLRNGDGELPAPATLEQWYDQLVQVAAEGDAPPFDWEEARIVELARLSVAPSGRCASVSNEHFEDGGRCGYCGDAWVTDAVVEEVSFCGCTNEELEAGKTCDDPQCPNAA